MSKREAAKVKIRSHLKTKGEDWCCVSVEMVRFWWKVLNQAVFDGELQTPKRFDTINFHNQILGLCTVFGRPYLGTVAIGVRREYDDRTTFLTVLVHEMVHQYQWQEEKIMNHGNTFYEWKWRVKIATGLPLNEYIECI